MHYARVPPVRCKLLPVDNRALSPCKELREPHGQLEAAHACVALARGGGQGACMRASVYFYTITE